MHNTIIGDKICSNNVWSSSITIAFHLCFVGWKFNGYFFTVQGWHHRIVNQRWRKYPTAHHMISKDGCKIIGFSLFNAFNGRKACLYEGFVSRRKYR